jgi:hypothetical protein
MWDKWFSLINPVRDAQGLKILGSVTLTYARNLGVLPRRDQEIAHNQPSIGLS